MGHGNVLAGEGYAAIPGFLGNCGEWTANPLLVSHGLALWALAAHYRITRDDKWLGNGGRIALAGDARRLRLGVATTQADDAGSRRQESSLLGTAAGGLGPRLAGRQHDLQRRLLHLRHDGSRPAAPRDQASPRRGNGEGVERLPAVPARSLRRGPRSRSPAAAGRRHHDPVCAADGSGTRLGETRLDLQRLQRDAGRRLGSDRSARPVG